MRTFLRDLRYTLRTLAKSPGFFTVAVLVLALGIGLNTAVFTMVNMILLKPLPGDNRLGALVGLYSFDKNRPDSYRDFSYANYADIRDRNQAFSRLTAHTLALVGLGEADSTRRVFVALVPANYFATFGVSPMMGRNFLPEEERPGSGTRVAVVGYDYWKKNGADPELVGKTIKINARPFTVVGIAPRGFTGTTTIISTELWLPTGVYELVVNDLFRQGEHTMLADRANHALMLFGRLKPGMTVSAAGPSLGALADQLAAAYPAENKDRGLQAHALGRTGISTSPQEDSEFVSSSMLMMAMAGVVLLIACMNLANMLLARGSARQKEIAIRLALGANRIQVVRQLLTEGLVLSVLGGALGLLLAYWAVGFFMSSIVPLLPIGIAVDARPDIRVLAATFALGVLSTIVFGLGPAWKLARTDVVTELKQGEPSSRRLRWFGRSNFRHVLVVAQIALSLALLTAAGLFARGAFKASKADPGFSLDGSVVVSLDPSLAGADEAQGRDVYRRLVDRLRALPGVQAASLASVVPFGDFTEGRAVRKVGDRPAEPAQPGQEAEGTISYGGGPNSMETREGVGASYYIIGRDYFQTLGIPVLRGRGFTEGEEQAASRARVAIVDEPLARRLFKDADPLGQHIYFPGRGEEESRPLEIVGIVRGVRHSLFDREPGPHVYLPFGRRYRAAMHLHVRMAGQGPAVEGALLRAIRQEIRIVDERMPILAIKTMREHRDTSMSSWLVRAGADLFTVFGALAVFLALVGIYGVRAYLVSKRTREIGVRMAIGATSGQVLWMVVREGLVLVATGLALGLLLAAGVGRLVSSLLYDVSPFDPLVFSTAPRLLAAAALLACYFPALRATKIAPTVALRTE
jgi:ABC-type antimicrobial peptide transport system permease subunit